MTPIRIAMITSDTREVFREYGGKTPGFGHAPDALLQGLAQISDCEVHVIACLQEPVQSPAKLAENIFYHPIVVPKIGWLRGAYVGCITAIRRKLRVIRPDIVHGQGTERYCALAAVFSGYPNVITIHGNMRHLARVSGARPFSFLRMSARLEAFVVPRTGGVLCNSQHTENLVRDRARQTWRIPNPLNTIFFSPIQRTMVSPPLLLNVGTISPLKRQLELLRLAESWYKQGMRFQMQFLGKPERHTPYAHEFFSFLSSPLAQRFAAFVGYESPEALVRRLDRASALIHVSQEESFGLAIAEALARNLKLFAFQAGGTAEVVSGIESAELYPAGDWQTLTMGVQRWINDGCPQPKSAADAIKSRYSAETVAEKHLEVYRCMAVYGRIGAL